MHNINFIRENPTEFDNYMKQRGEHPISNKILELDKVKRETQTVLQNLLAERNSISKNIGKLKSENKDASSEMNKVDEIKNKINNLKELETIKDEELKTILSRLPNIADKTVPIGSNEADNTKYREWGEKPEFEFKPKTHFELGEDLGLMNFETASKLSGSRFVLLKNQLSKLERAIANFMLDKHTNDNGYIEMHVPYLVKADTLYGTGQLPKFAEDLFTAGDDHWLIPTAEIPLTALHSNEILNINQLPMRVTSYTPCFRSEAGSYGKDTKGLIRQHQFEKVELVQIVHPSKSFEALEELLNNAEEVLQVLDLPYQVVELCTGDLGFSSAKTYDIEVWMPSQNKYREISSCSNFIDFQARRGKIRIKDGNDKILAHTINGSALAAGRALIAVIENNFDGKNSIKIPKALQDFMGKTEIELS